MAFPDGISVALPIHNEAEALPDVVRKAAAVLGEAGIEPWELVLVNDGSTDGSAEVMAHLADQYDRVVLVHHVRRQGFAAVQQSCYHNSGCDWVFLLPADGQVDPAVLRQLLPETDSAGIVCGTVQRSQDNTMGEWMSRAYHFVVSRLFDLHVGRFGACLLVRREVATGIDITSATPVAMTELLVRARAAGIGIAGIEIEKHPRRFGRNRGGYLLGSAFLILRDLLRLRRAVRAMPSGQ